MSVLCEVCVRLQSRAPYSRFFRKCCFQFAKTKVEISKLQRVFGNVPLELKALFGVILFGQLKSRTEYPNSHQNTHITVQSPLKLTTSLKNRVNSPILAWSVGILLPHPQKRLSNTFFQDMCIFFSITPRMLEIIYPKCIWHVLKRFLMLL